MWYSNLILADELNFPHSYHTDLLKNYTGQNTQQHIHRLVIERAKEMLIQARLTVGEIGYQLGFDVPQSFSRLFKNKTNEIPLHHRHRSRTNADEFDGAEYKRRVLVRQLKPTN